MSKSNIALHKKLQRVCDDVGNNITNINCGGCGVFAYEFCKRLHDLGHTSARIRVYGFRADMFPYSLNEIEEQINGNDIEEYWDYDVDFAHIVVEFDGYLWDADGKRRLNKVNNLWNGCFAMYKGNISLASLKSLVKYQYGWNSAYNRRQTPKLRRIMDAKMLA